MAVIDFTTLLIVALTPPLVALVRRPGWPDPVVALLALAVSTAVYTLGRFLDGALTWPLGAAFAVGLMAAFGTQQLVYQAIKETQPMQQLKAFGSVPRSQDRPRSPGVS